MFGEIKIYFGKVVDVNDIEEKTFRCRVSIDALTNEIFTENLPWYFPWYGVNYLPEINDVVSVIMFDGNISTCFYGNKVDVNKSSLAGDDYANYLEIYKRKVSNKDVELTYIKSTGILFKNGDGKINIDIDKINFFVDSNSIEITKDKINIGNQNQEASLLGDKTVTQLHDMITHQKNVNTFMFNMFNAIMSVASGNPYTTAIGGAIAGLITQQPTIEVENTKIDKTADNIQSKKVFIE